MELRHLRYFLAVVESGSVTRAAASALVAQPSLSRQLRRLERDLGVALFDRDGGRLRLSPAGERFVPIARDLVTRADRARAAAAALRDGATARLTVAAPAATVTDVIAPYLATTDREHPFVTVREELRDGAYAALAAGADLAVSSTPPPARLTGRMLARLPVFAYVARSHPWAARTQVELAALAEAPLLLLTAEHGTRQLFDRALGDAGLRCDAAFETSSAPIAQALAAAGHGVAVVSDDPRYDLHPLAIATDAGQLRIELWGAWDGGHYAAETVGWLADRLGAHCVAAYGAAAAPDGR